MGHHTKDKGDIGVAKAYADLVAQGFMVLFPTTEHAPFDLVAYRDGAFWRIQVKYRALWRGVMRVVLESTWSDRHGIHKQPIDKSQIDMMCIYCPDTDACYYFDPRLNRTSVTLRVLPSRNNQSAKVLLASEFRTMPTGDSSGVEPASSDQTQLAASALAQLELWSA